MKTKTKHRFDFLSLEKYALESWVAWDKHDTPSTRTDMFLKLRNLSYATIFAGNFEKKFKIKLGSDPTAAPEERVMEAANDYTIYLFERLIIRSMTFIPQKKTAGVVLDEGVEANTETLTKALKKLVKHPFDIVSFEEGYVTLDDGRLAAGYNIDYKYHKFALQPYINLNLRHILLAKKDAYGVHDLLDSLELSLKNGDSGGIVENQYLSDLEEVPLQTFSKEFLGKKVIRILHLFYTYEEIKRLFGMTCELLYNNDKSIKDMTLPLDIQDFAIVMMGVAKRVARENQSFNHQKVKPKDFTKALESAARSSIFLSSVVNTNYFAKELLLALDLESLYRLSTIMGGRTMQIPTIRELDTLIGACASISDALIKGKDPVQAIKDNKADLGLVFSHKVNVKKFVQAALEAHSVFGEDKNTQPLVAVLLSSISCLEQTFSGMLEKANTAGPVDLARLYSEMVQSTTKFSESLVQYSMAGKQLLKDELTNT